MTGKEGIPYRSLGVFKIKAEPLPSRSLGVQRRFVASQIEPGSETPVLQVLTQNDSGVLLHVGVCLFKIVQFGQVVNLAIFAIGLN